jgi:hypothetical protein
MKRQSYESDSQARGVLIRSPRHDQQGLIRQGPLKRLRFVSRRRHPGVLLVLLRRDQEHSLGEDSAKLGVGTGVQEGE